MAYEVAYTATALKQLPKLDPPLNRRILDNMDEIEARSDPRARGKGLVGDRSGFWRYRIGEPIDDSLDRELLKQFFSSYCRPREATTRCRKSVNQTARAHGGAKVWQPKHTAQMDPRCNT